MKNKRYEIRRQYIRKTSMVRIIRNYRDTSKNIVTVGSDMESKVLRRYFMKSPLYWGHIDFQNHNGRDISELLYEDITEFIVIISEEKLRRKYEGYFLEIGFSKEQLISVECDGIGCQLDIYDVTIGYTRKSEKGMHGFFVFGDLNPQKKPFVILTLGGSTTDPTTGNVISWSEFLYDSAKKIYENIQVVCAGVNTQVVSQELFKLIRDGYLFNPDLVISYSGVNDFSEFYHDEVNPFIMCYNKRIFNEAIKKGIMNGRDVLQGGKLKEFTIGIESEKPISRAEHWIRCEKYMKYICDSEGRDFIGILQPQNFLLKDDINVKTRNKYYPEAIRKVKELNESWLLDFTGIFEEDNNVFYDNCHVYEHGNKKIAKKILMSVISSMKKKGVI